MIEPFGSEHSATINDLAKEGKIKPVSFTVNGEQHEANSLWAATDWLKANGHYAKNSVVVWDL
jgi:hypothetical protein